jgi:pSer/pThr/pTyr-binding forkhead associated (FHA) protein
MATLCLLAEDGRTVREWEIGNKPVTVGRGASVDVRIDDDGLSRRHFMLQVNGGDYLVKDLSSRNGTWVDGFRAPEANLRHKDTIVAGRTRFRFLKAVTGPYDTVVLPAALAPGREMAGFSDKG